MADPPKPRKQCAKCPWKVATGKDIPNGFAEDARARLRSMIAEPGTFLHTKQNMQCHETANTNPLPCVGWLVHQLGEGNNLRLRMAAALGQIDGNVQTVGPQHRRPEDVVPADWQSTETAE